MGSGRTSASLTYSSPRAHRVLISFSTRFRLVSLHSCVRPFELPTHQRPAGVSALCNTGSGVLLPTLSRADHHVDRVPALQRGGHRTGIQLPARPEGPLPRLAPLREFPAARPGVEVGPPTRYPPARVGCDGAANHCEAQQLGLGRARAASDTGAYRNACVSRLGHPLTRTAPAAPRPAPPPPRAQPRRRSRRRSRRPTGCRSAIR